MEISTILNGLVYVFLAWFIFTRFAPIKGLQNLNNDEFRDRMQQQVSNPILIDVREPHEYKQGYIPGAINIPLSQLKSRTGEIPKDKDLLLYCRSGMRSKQAGRVLSKQGFASMAHLKGGILSWGGTIKK